MGKVGYTDCMFQLKILPRLIVIYLFGTVFYSFRLILTHDSIVESCISRHLSTNDYSMVIQTCLFIHIMRTSWAKIGKTEKMNICLLLQILFVNGDLAERREYELQRKRREFVAKRRSKQINMDITQLKKNVLIGVSIKNSRFNSMESFAFV